jgi:hypothetical protein
LVDGDEPAADSAIVDAGLKALAFDLGIRARPAPSTSTEGPPLSAATNRFGARRQDPAGPRYCDPTVNAYDRYVCVRVKQLWPITAAGRKRPTLSRF